MKLKDEQELIKKITEQTNVPSLEETHQAILHYLSECYDIYTEYQDEGGITEVQGKFGVTQYGECIYITFPNDRQGYFEYSCEEVINSLNWHGVSEEIEEIAEANNLFNQKTLDNIDEIDFEEVLIFYLAKTYAEKYINTLKDKNLTIVKTQDIFDWENYF